MSAAVETALYAWCSDCSEGSDVGVTRAEAEAWAEQHDKDNHQEDS